MYYEEDYIIRMIQGMGALLRAMAAALQDHEPQAALEASDEALQLATGLPASLADTLTLDSLVRMMTTAGVPDPKRLLLAAEVFVRRSQAYAQMGKDALSHDERERAVALLALVREHGGVPDVEAAEDLERELG
jgi:hypothetical protein